MELTLVRITFRREHIKTTIVGWKKLSYRRGGGVFFQNICYT